MYSLKDNFLKELRFTPEQLGVLKKLGEYQGQQLLFAKQTPETLESLRHIALVESSESSTRIEGNATPRDRVKALIREDAKPQNRSEQEVAGYRDVLSLIHTEGAYMPFAVDTILRMHKTLYGYMPEEGGVYKTRNNEIRELNPDGTLLRVRFRAVPAAETPAAMEELVSSYSRALGVLNVEPLIVIPLTILDFLCIHPFRDGNGRVARLLTLLLLYHCDYNVGRYVSLERITEQAKTEYYQALEASSAGWHEGKHDPHPWLNYFWGMLLKAYHELEEGVRGMGTGKGTKGEQVRQAVLKRFLPFSLSDIEEDCPLVSHDMVRIVLRQMKEEGLISPQGKGRGAKWVINRTVVADK